MSTFYSNDIILKNYVHFVEAKGLILHVFLLCNTQKFHYIIIMLATWYSLSPKKLVILGFKNYPKKHVVLLNLVCVHAQMSTQ
jgi:hypothetical protein